MNLFKKFNEWRVKNDGWNSVLSLVAVFTFLAVGYAIYQKIGQQAAITFVFVTFFGHYAFLLWRTKGDLEVVGNLILGVLYFVVAGGAVLIASNLFGIDSEISVGPILVLAFIGIVFFFPAPTIIAKWLHVRVDKVIQRIKSVL